MHAMASSLLCQAPHRCHESYVSEADLDSACELPPSMAEEILNRMKRGSSVKAWGITHSAGLAPRNEQTISDTCRKLCPMGAVDPGIPPCVDASYWVPSIEDIASRTEWSRTLCCLTPFASRRR